MQKQGYRESTIQPRIRALKAIARGTDLLNPESVKAHLASAQLSENRKEKLCDDLAGFYRYKGIHFDKPRYRRVEKLPFIPLEPEIDQLISGVGKKTAAFLQLLKETGMRPGEAWNLRWIDIDFENNSFTISPENNSKPRRLGILRRLVSILQATMHTPTSISSRAE
jgi:integrase